MLSVEKAHKVCLYCRGVERAQERMSVGGKQEKQPEKVSSRGCQMNEMRRSCCFCKVWERFCQESPRAIEIKLN
jgi:hypothetical protein